MCPVRGAKRMQHHSLWGTRLEKLSYRDYQAERFDPLVRITYT